MIRYQAFIVILLSASFQINAQFSAGLDKTICSGTGADLGVPTQVIQPTWCITWTPAEGLDDPHSAQPHATPKHTTIYTVAVLTDDWQGVITDDVKVTVGFGDLKFTPNYLYQGSDETSQAQVLTNPDNEQVTWSIQGPDLGCMIDPMSGVITPGNEFGTITIRATKTNHPACFAEDNIDINEGVKDVTARDATHPGRIAKDLTDTLYLIGEGPYIITAIPNADGFSEGSPFWYNDGTEHAELPFDGQVTISGSASNEHHFTAGSEEAGYAPNVVVKHLASNEFVIDLAPLVNAVTGRIKAINDKLKEKISKKYPGVPNLTVEVNIASFKYKKSRAELFNDPGYDYKYVVEAGGSMGLSGKLFHPFFTRVFDLGFLDIYLGTELYIEPYFEASLTGMASKDPSKEDPGWTFIGNPVKATATGGLRGAFNVIGQSSGYQLEGGFSLSSEISFDLTFYVTNGELKLKTTITPLQGNTKLTVNRYIDPKKKWTFFNYTVDLIDKWTSEDYLLFDFGAQN